MFRAIDVKVGDLIRLSPWQSIPLAYFQCEVVSIDNPLSIDFDDSNYLVFTLKISQSDTNSISRLPSNCKMIFHTSQSLIIENRK